MRQDESTLANEAASDDEEPADIAAALNEIPDLDTEQLRNAAREVLSPQEVQRLEALAHKAQDGGLTPAEERERDELSHRYEKALAVRSSAIAELHKRGEDFADPPDERGRFEELSKRWRAETAHLSNVKKRVSHPAYREIVAMGKPAVGFILEDLAEYGPDDWFWALSTITGENPITAAIAGSMTAMTEAWLQWGTTAWRENRDIQRSAMATQCPY